MRKSSLTLRKEAWTELLARTILENPWIPHEPTEKQARFLLLPNLEAFYGGAAGGGKSDALLMAALQYVDVPGYSAILFRRTFKRLSLPGALMDRAKEWLVPKGIYWNQTDHVFIFPSGAKLSFGHLEHELDKHHYQSAEFQFIGFDEATEFEESQFRYMFSRLRRLKGFDVPLRMRAASNPGGVGHDWVKMRFLVEGPIAGRVFIPAKARDNEHLDLVEYIKSLQELDPISRRQLLDGDWTARQAGGLFKREWFEIVQAGPSGIPRLRYWDLAATEAKKGKDPDWTAGGLAGIKDGIAWIFDVRRFRESPRMVEAAVKQSAVLDGAQTAIWMEQEPGASGVSVIDRYRRVVLLGYDFHAHKPTGNKQEFWRPLSAMAEAGNVKLVNGPWVNWWLDEAEAAPYGAHDDGLDAVSRAVVILSKTAKEEGPWVF